MSASELLAMNLDGLPVDRLVLELMADAKHVKQIKIVNGLTPGSLTKALNGEHVGTIVHADYGHGRRPRDRRRRRKEALAIAGGAGPSA